jgi:shikimate kinase
MKNIENIVLVGLMGSGKTTIGKQLSKKLKKLFIDTDLLIKQKTGVDITTIFELEGEDGFRLRETNLLHELLLEHDKVIATGGGIVLLEANRKLLQKIGKIIYLKADPNDLAIRLRQDKSRPLIQNVDLLKKLNTLFEERDSLYKSLANYIIETKNKRVIDINEEIMELLS